MSPKFSTYLQTRFGSTQKGVDFLQFAGWLLCLGITLPVMSSILISPVVVLIVGMLFVLGIAWLVIIWKKGLVIISSPIDAGMVAIFFAVLVTTYFSIDPSRGVRAIWQWSALILLFYMVLALFRLGFSFYPLVKALLIITSVFVFFGYFDFFLWLFNWYTNHGWSIIIPQTIIRPSGLVSNPNPFAGILAIIFGLAAVVFIEFKQYRSIWLKGWLVTTLIMLVLTQSRGAWAGLLLAFFVYGLSKVWLRTKRETISLRAWGIILLMIIAGILVFLILLLAFRPDTFTSDTPLSGRLELWSIAIQSWLSHPWLGSGSNSYPTIQMHVIPVPYKPLHPTSHNFYLDVLAEMGLVGFVATLLLTVQILWLLWRRWRQWTPWTIVFLVPLVAFAVQMQFNASSLRPIVIAVVLLAALVADLTPILKHHPIALYGFPVSFFLVCLWVCLIISGLVGWKITRQYEIGISGVTNGDWKMASRAFSEGQSLTPYKNSLFLYASGFSDGVWAFQDESRLLPAIENQESLVLRESGWSAHYANLAGLYRQGDRKDEAEIAMGQAIDLAPDVLLYYLNLGIWYEEDGDIEMATSLYQQLYQLPHTWHNAPFWQMPVAAEAINGLTYADTARYLEAKERQENGDADGADQIFRNIEGYEALVNGQFDDAKAIFNDGLDIFQDRMARNEYTVDYKAGTNAYLGVGIAYLYMGDIVSATVAFEQAEIWASGQTSNIVALWQATLPTAASEELVIVTTDLQHYYAVDETRKFSDYYVFQVFEQTAIPHDLLPQLSCFTFSSVTGTHMQLLQEWYVFQDAKANADYVQAIILGEDNGLSPCVPFVNSVSQGTQ